MIYFRDGKSEIDRFISNPRVGFLPELSYLTQLCSHLWIHAVMGYGPAAFESEAGKLGAARECGTHREGAGAEDALRWEGKQEFGGLRHLVWNRYYRLTLLG